LGAVVVFLALAITGFRSQNSQLVRSACLAMEITAWFVIVPFSIASLSSGIAQALFTRWGLFDYYWIVVKLFLTLAMTGLLLLHLQPISYLAGAASEVSFSKTQEMSSLVELIAKSGAAIIVLLATTTISVYKPWGRIQFRPEQLKRPLSFYVLVGLVGLMIIFVIMHLFGGGMGRH
jgi:hypothetical protein